MAMAVGEWVSVSSQADVEQADLELERKHLAADPEGELEELTRIYEQRGLSRGLAEQVARELHAGDVLAAHARDELGHHETTKARPVQAALASASSFTAGGTVPFLGMLGPFTGTGRILFIVLVTILGLTLAGILGARAAGVGVRKPTLRVVLGGATAMAITACVGQVAVVAGV